MIFKSCERRGNRASVLLFAFLFIFFAGLFFFGLMAFAGKVETDEETSRAVKIEFPAPESHKNNWIKQHGISARMDFGLSENLYRAEKSCFVCHEKTDCTRCHNVNKPSNHTGTWRTFSHGFSAEADISSCSVCHRQSYCVRCHAETAPSSHRGGWDSSHCSSCHYDNGFTVGDSCGVCHRSAQHLSAPHPVSSGLDCLQCHG